MALANNLAMETVSNFLDFDTFLLLSIEFVIINFLIFELLILSTA